MDASSIIYFALFNASASFIGHVFLEISQGLLHQLAPVGQEQAHAESNGSASVNLPGQS